MTNTINERSLHTIADEVYSDWKKPNYAAVPYLVALHHMDSIDDMYGLEEGVFVVLYFLNNANSWRGETARRVKLELNGMVKAHNKRVRG